MIEVWKDIEGYEGLYQVSNLGRVKSLDRYIRYKNGVMHFYKGDLMPQRKRRKDQNYLSVNLHKNDVLTSCAVHRLVAKAFIPNPENKPQINHIDENPENNCAENLEWVTAYENMHHNKLIENINKKSAKPVNAYDGQGNLVHHFCSMGEAERCGFNRYAISANINGRTKTSGGYVWRIAE